MSDDKKMGKAFSEGIKIALVGGECSKSLGDDTAQLGGWPSRSRLRHFINQPIEMSNTEAISILEKIETDIYGRIAIGKAIDALIGPWVKTADRLPTEADAEHDGEILTLYQDDETTMLGCDYWAYVAKFPEQFPYWMPIPPLPEVTE